MKNILLGLFLTTLIISCDKEIKFKISEPEKVLSGFQFTEGPNWIEDGTLIFSDIPANKVYKWNPDSTGAEIFLDSSGNSNGIESMPDGTIILAQHSGRVSRVLESNELEAIITEYQGKRFNSPNDLAIRSDGTIYFTDPPFGVAEEDRELSFAGVFLINKAGELKLVYDGFSSPNGITFSPDESQLYVSDSETGNIMSFEMLASGDLTNEQLFANVGAVTDNGGADGLITDADGRLYTTGPNGLIVFDKKGTKLAQVQFNEQITNLEWENGDNLSDILYVTAATSVYEINVNK